MNIYYKMPYSKEQNRENYLRRKEEGKYDKEGSLKLKINDRKLCYIVHIMNDNKIEETKLYNYKWELITSCQKVLLHK